jgi:ribonuclease-3
MNLDLLGEKLGVKVEPQLLEQALTHSSYSYEQGSDSNNERLEFLGDAVLGFVVTDHVVRVFPDLQEGRLHRLVNTVVSEKALAYVARKIELGQHLLLGKGEIGSGGRDRPAILADAMEAIFGATLISCGIEEATALIHRLIIPLIANRDELRLAPDPKHILFKAVEELKLGEVGFSVTHDGPPHDRSYFATLKIGGKAVAFGSGRTKKNAERDATIHALEIMRVFE